ncbi:MAG: proline--tRNA ligase [Deltaproteobacteria bacterium]|nr:proline--tRNA ligase [Deltaproteobacteria bacterium]
MQERGTITPRAENYSQWYLDVIREADLAEPAEVVKGCMVIKPNGYSIWQQIQRDLDDRFKETGHKNAYFPMLIPMSFIEKEAEHVEGFSPELAVVTHAGGKKLEEPYVIRPTSETIIGYFFSKWIQSWRDLPLLINQWANVMRWELKTRMFLRTGEFLWQEGHTAHASHDEAMVEAQKMLGVYADFAEQVMAMPVVKGDKSETEKFAGAERSMTIEAMMQNGMALQSGTSHDLGQNFGRAFDVRFQNRDGELEYVWQTSWGVSTRLVGGLIMTHSDDSGLVLPPRLAPVHVVIVPIYRKAAQRAEVLGAAEKIAAELRAQTLYGRRLDVEVDDREEYKPGYKFYYWERRGVPLRLELGPRDMESRQVMARGRTGTFAEKQAWSWDGLSEKVLSMLEAMQGELLESARARREEMSVQVDDYDQFKSYYGEGRSRFSYAHWCGDAACEAKIKEDTKATIRCIPWEREEESGSCMVCGKPSKGRVLIAKAY